MYIYLKLNDCISCLIKYLVEQLCLKKLNLPSSSVCNYLNTHLHKYKYICYLSGSDVIAFPNFLERFLGQSIRIDETD